MKNNNCESVTVKMDEAAPGLLINVYDDMMTAIKVLLRTSFLFSLICSSAFGIKLKDEMMIIGIF